MEDTGTERNSSSSTVGIRLIDEESLGLLSHVLTRASKDPALYNMSVPRLGSLQAVADWMNNEGWQMWVIIADDAPVGYIGFHEVDFTFDPERYKDFHEIDYYLLPEYRGLKILPRAWKILERKLPRGMKIVAEAWIENTASLEFCKREGWTYAGESYWRSDEDPPREGACERYTYEIS